MSLNFSQIMQNYACFEDFMDISSPIMRVGDKIPNPVHVTCDSDGKCNH